MSVRWEGVDDVLAALEGIEQRVDGAGSDAVSAGMTVIEEASVPLVPIETGALVGSRRLTVSGNRAALSYGTAYARYQHYRLDLRHESGQALFLEQPVRTEKDAAVGQVARTLREAL